MTLNEIGRRKNAARFLHFMLITLVTIILSIVVLAINSIVEIYLLADLVIAGNLIMVIGLGSRYKEFKDLLEVIEYSSSGTSGVAR